MIILRHEHRFWTFLFIGLNWLIIWCPHRRPKLGCSWPSLFKPIQKYSSISFFLSDSGKTFFSTF